MSLVGAKACDRNRTFADVRGVSTPADMLDVRWRS